MKTAKNKKKMTFNQFQEKFYPEKKQAHMNTINMQDDKYYERLGRGIVNEVCLDLKIRN